MFAESELLPLSGLQHLVFCERQCALIHVERAWRENALTAEGRVIHERAHSADTEARADLRIVRGLPMRSLRLGLVGKADIVELHQVRESGPAGVSIEGLPGTWSPFPVEYKRGEPKWIDCDRVQLCAQALCLEEMWGTVILDGALYYGKTRRREGVTLDGDLRAATERAAARFHELVAAREVPTLRRMPKCRSCSLLDICLPPRRARPTVTAYLNKTLADRN